MRERNGTFVLDLEWRGEAKTDVTIGKYDYGGLFLRMPWREGIAGEVVNAARQRNERAEGQRAMWIDVGMQVEGRNDLAHVAIFDHPDNAGYPQAWRVDRTARRRLGEIARRPTGRSRKGQTEVLRHQFVDLHRHAQRRRDDQRLERVQRQHGRPSGAVGDRADARDARRSS